MTISKVYQSSEPRRYVEDHIIMIMMIMVFLLQIVTWMENCLIGTHTTSSYIYSSLLVSNSQNFRTTLDLCKVIFQVLHTTHQHIND